MKNRLGEEIVFVLLGLSACLVAGLIVGAPLLLFTAGMAAYLAWNFYNLKRLAAWLGKPGKNIPETWGIWDEIYRQLYLLYQRQRKAKKKLTAIVTRFQESTQALPYATIVLNRDMEIEWFNNAARKLFALNKRFDTGQRIDNLIRTPVFTRYLSRGDFGKDLEFEYNDRYIRLAMTPYGNNQFLLGAQDATRRKKLEVMRRDFTANASHELRTPLTVVAGYVEALQSSADEKIRVPLEHIQVQTKRMQSILDDLIALSRLETEALPGDNETIPLAALMTEVFAEIKALDQNRHRLAIDTADVTLAGNREEIRTVFSNLLTNAVRYSAEGATIKFYAAADERGLCVTVEDQGIGIAPEHIHRLTERFYRVDPGRSREQGGTGLGLAIVKHILDRHHARLEIESTPGVGSIFRCCFPARQIVQNQIVQQ